MATVKQLDKRSGITYVYESVSYWDREKKQPRSRRTLIGRLDPETGKILPTDGRGKRRAQKEADPAVGTVKIFAQIPLSLSEPAKTIITTYSGKRDGAGNFLARGLRWAVGVVALP